MFGTFTDWRRFPDPRKGELLIAPLEPVVTSSGEATTDNLFYSARQVMLHYA
jgi:hypothetical protein